MEHGDPEWLVAFTLPREVGNPWFLREKLKGRLVESQLGGATVISGYIKAPGVLDAISAFGQECMRNLGPVGSMTMRRAISVRAEKVR